MEAVLSAQLCADRLRFQLKKWTAGGHWDLGRVEGTTRNYGIGGSKMHK